MRTVDPEKHEEKRQEILEAAKRCFARSGFQGASISEICAEAKISPGHLYHYFTGKEEIIGAMAAANLAETTERFSHVFETQGVIEAFSSDLDRLKGQHARHGKAVAFEILAEAQRNPAMAKVMREHTQGMTDMLAAVIHKAQERGEIDPDLEPEISAAVLISIIDGSKTLAIRNPQIDAKKSFEVLKTLVSRFLAPPKSEKR